MRKYFSQSNREALFNTQIFVLGFTQLKKVRSFSLFYLVGFLYFLAFKTDMVLLFVFFCEDCASFVLLSCRDVFDVFNPFLPSGLFLYPQKTLESLSLFWCCQGVEKGCIGIKWVNIPVQDQIPVQVTDNCGITLSLRFRWDFSWLIIWFVKLNDQVESIDYVIKVYKKRNQWSTRKHSVISTLYCNQGLSCVIYLTNVWQGVT